MFLKWSSYTEEDGAFWWNTVYFSKVTNLLIVIITVIPMWMQEKHLSQTQNSCCSWKNISHTAKNNKLSLHDSKHQSSDRQKYPTVPRDPQSLVHLNPSRGSKNQKHLMVHSECPHLSPLQGPRKSVGSWRRMGWHLSFSELGGGFSLEMVMALRRQHLG